MKSSVLLCITFAAIKSLHAAPQTSFLDDYVLPYRLFRFTAHSALLKAERGPYRQRSLAASGKLQAVIGENTKFPCSLNNTRSTRVPRSVNALRPGDIKVIGAIGDSLTVGFGTTSTDLINLFIENRGLSFSGGGQATWRQFLTIPNILKVFNPDLIGYSLGPSLGTEKASQFNAAEVGAISQNTPYMAKVLVKRIKSDPRVNLNDDWKMINIFIGANDFCSEICYFDRPERALEKHKADMLRVLRTLRDNLPRTFVNLIVPPSVDVLAEITGAPKECSLTLSFNCPCIIGSQFAKSRRRIVNVIREWQKLDQEIAGYAEFDTESFQVVAQTVFVNFSVPLGSNGLTDFTYLATECFHLSQKGHALVSNLLWNNILQPVGKKRRTAEIFLAQFNCPNEDMPYLYTKSNSIKA